MAGGIKLPKLTEVKPVLGEGLKGTVGGTLGIGLGQLILGNLGQIIGSCIAASLLKGNTGVTVMVIGCTDAIIDMFAGEEVRRRRRRSRPGIFVRRDKIL